VLQFAASVVLVAGTVVVYNQLDYVRHMDLGIDLEQILTVPGPRTYDETTREAVHTFVQELHHLPGIRQVATSTALPGQGFNWYSSGLRRTTASPTTGVDGVFTRIDTSFIKLYGLQLVAGPGFAHLTGSDSEGEAVPVILNETAVHGAGFDTPADAIDQSVNMGDADFRVVGVFKDFNWSSAHQKREAILFGLTDAGDEVSMKVSTEDLPATVAAVERLYKARFPGNPFRYSFLDERFDEQYRNDQRFATLFGTFAGLAILIACLGLLGMATFTAQRRTKEIGIRKALGATVPGVVVLLSKDFVRLVLLGFVIAVPIAYLIMQRWLEDFAYQIQIGPGVFVLTGALVVLVALLTVGYHAVKAALADPVQSLRCE
jgi:putative ABC transport system permease protein